MPFIYKISNDINDKVYVGKTVFSLEKRWKEHLHEYKRERCKNRPLYRAMNKYGPEHFFISEIEDCSPDVLCEREIYWIKFYDSYGHNGYNATFGGDGKHFIDYDIIYEKWNNGLTCKNIAIVLNMDESHVRKILRDIYNITHDDIKKRIIAVKSKSVIQLDIHTGYYIKEYNSLSDVCKSLGVHHRSTSHIADVCNGKRKSAYGYKWMWGNQ